MKTCRICQTEKPESEFGRRAGPQGVLRNECRPCGNKQRNPRSKPAPREEKFMGWVRK